MRTRPVTILGLAAVVPVVLLTLSCGDDPATGPDPDPDPDPENVAPTLSPIPAQTVLRNTINPRSVAVALQIDDPDDDNFTVVVASDDESVVSGSTFGCGAGPCALTLAPSPEATATVTLDVTVEDGGGGQAAASFEVNVVPHLVTSTGDDGPGSLRAAVESAEPGDVIGFDTDGAFAGPQTIGLLNEIVLDKDLTIEGSGVDRLTVSGNGSVRVFRVTEAAEVTIQDLTIADGRAEPEEIAIGETVVFLSLGGGVFMDTDSNVTLRDCVITGSVAVSGESPGGGAIANLEGTLDIERCNIHGNSATALGGGMVNVAFSANATPAVTSLSNSTVSDNTTTSATLGVGGGVYNAGAFIIDGSRIVGNTAVGGGGGVFNDFERSMVIRNGSEISENTADSGGGIGNDGSLTITESTVEANSSASIGGGIDNRPSGVLTLETGTSVLGNVAAELGGGIYNDDGSVVLEAGASVTGNTAEAPAPSGGGVFNEGTLENDGDVSGNTPDDVAP